MTDPTPLPDWSSAGPVPPSPPAPPVSGPPPGWYPDPGNGAAVRYWDGAAWTAHQSAAVAAYAGPPAASFGFGESIKRAFSKWLDYSGRATLSEFWWFYLFTIIVSFVLYIPFVIALFALIPTSTRVTENGEVTATAPSSGTLTILAVLLIVFFALYLVLFLVTLPLAVRRLHDTDRSGWWYLISLVPFGGIVLLVFWVSAGTPGPNQYGPPST